MYISNLPTGTSLLLVFTSSITVSLSNCSLTVVTYPIGLLSKIYTNSSTILITLSSNSTISVLVFTLVPSSYIILPFTFTLPSKMYSSHFLLEATPASAIYFCNLISSIIYSHFFFLKYLIHPLNI
ncbi:hypothetical protein D3C72_1624340 [compost metagenome]